MNKMSKTGLTKRIAVVLSIFVVLVLTVSFSFANTNASSISKANAEDILSGMSIHDKLCQMLVVYRADAVQEDNETYNLDKNPYGGIIYYTPDVDAAGDVKLMVQNDQSASNIPLFTVIDEEGGQVSRLAGDLSPSSNRGRNVPFDGCTPLYSMYYYKNDGSNTAKQNAETIGKYLTDYGFNWNLAPVADVANGYEGDESFVQDRCYSDDFEEAAELVSSAVDGYKSTGVMTSLKHFPGHGSVSSDSHYGTVLSPKLFEQIEEDEMLPFKEGVAAGADSIMLGHIIVEDFDSEPASLSEKWCSYIRNNLDFDGLIITDGMTMRSSESGQSVVDGTPAAVAAKTINAGVDVILTPESPDQLVEELEKLVSSGEISEDTIDAAVTRILNKKIDKGIL